MPAVGEAISFYCGNYGRQLGELSYVPTPEELQKSGREPFVHLFYDNPKNTLKRIKAAFVPKGFALNQWCYPWELDDAGHEKVAEPEKKKTVVETETPAEAPTDPFEDCGQTKRAIIKRAIRANYEFTRPYKDYSIGELKRIVAAMRG